ncbi:hypothetical protein BDY21DRAFT_356584 [Lineolata rhizophorae]|uniref:Secreted protein n=1 Tax=Lineolata rhizophorae TaxID=578093 RepID=A0A6A6NP01_9PEZI|nr:hypothetical protein BDY21DRAFT_356584 [Lineolata rhizophorae]
MQFFLLLVAAAPFLAKRAAASLNCTATAPIDMYSCPDATCDMVGTIETGELAQFGCASDQAVEGERWMWNYNGYYTKSTTTVEGCNLNGMPYDNTDVLPMCSEDTYVLELTDNAPLQPCPCHIDSEDPEA